MACHTAKTLGLLVAVAVSAVAAGCASSPVLSTSPSPTKCQVTLSTSTLSVDVAGTTGSIMVNTERECAWEGAAAVDWIALTSSQTGRGPGQLDFRVLANPDSLARQGAITVSDQRLEINQGAAPCRVTVGTSAFTLGADGGNEAVPVTAPRGCSWTVTSAANWISVPVDTGSGSARLAFTVQANAGAPRSGRLTVGDQTITIAQSTGVPSCSYAISPMTQAIAATGGPGAVAVTAGSGCAWSATSNAPWISVQAGSIGAGNGSVTFAVTPNTGPARSGTASVAGQLVTFNQAESAPPPQQPPLQPLCSYTISPGVASMGVSAGSTTVAVTAPSGCSWTVASQAAWIAVTSGASGAGSAGVTVSVSANPGAARSGIVSIAGLTFTVNQSANCSYSINPANATIGAGGGAGPGIAVTATAGCAWTSTTNAAWISVTSGSAGVGNGSVSFTTTVNAGASRSGTVTIGGQTLTVNQAAGCSYSINPSSASIKADGGNGPSIKVTATTGCSWTAASNDAWIEVTAGANGTGNGNVTFKVSKNAGSERIGTLTIAGQTFTVTQQKH